MAQWRRFAFFEKELLKDQNGVWLRGIDVTSMSGNRGLLVIGDASGFIHLANRQLETRAFRAHEHFVSHVIMMKKANLLVSIGDGHDPRDPELIKASKAVAEASRTQAQHDEQMFAATDSSGSTALVKIWRTDQQDRDGKPKLLQQIKIFAKFPEQAVTAFAVSDDLSQISVGLLNGAIILFRSDAKRRSDRPPLLLQPANQYPVTSLQFATKNGALSLYAATKRGLTCYHCDDAKTKANQMPRSVVLDERGVALHCGAVSDDGDMAIGQSDAVYFYTPEDRTVCFGFEGDKKYLSFFKQYLLVAHVDPRGRHQVNVYDLQNKFIAFNWTLTNTAKSTTRFDETEEIRHVVSEFGAVFVLSSLGYVYRLTEKDTASKLDILFRKHLYSIAISLAFSSNYDLTSIMDIFRAYGDHLYQKGDFDGSLRQYARTIGYVEPSYVIRQFLDAQRIHNLTTYLEALHAKAFATAEHTTLLLNCYTKLKDVKKLDSFLLIDETTTDTTKQQLTFDVETALTVLRDHYPTHALALAKKHEEHSWYLKIQLDRIHSETLSDADQARCLDALAYIEGLSFAEANLNLRKYGRTLVTHVPGPTTELLKQLCTGRFPHSPEKADPANFLHLFVSHRAELRQFLEYIVDVETVRNPQIGNTLLEMVLSDTSAHNDDGASPDDDDGLEDEHKAAVVVPSAKANEAAVLALLDNPRVKYDEDHALILMQMHGLKQGKRYLYQKLHMYHMLLQHHMEEGEDQAVLDQVKQHGESNANLWLLALKYFSDKKDDAQYTYLTTLLGWMDNQPNLQIPPLQVVSILSQARDLPLSVVRQYVVNQLKQDQSHIDRDMDEIKKFKQDTQKMRGQLTAIGAKAMVFQATKCDLCGHDLDLPVVHFMCGHSFHQNCISETDRECMTCAPEHRHFLSLKASLEQKASNHEQFYNQLETAADGFNTIAERRTLGFPL
ncbi:Aste57867_13931 [Aphanomyces stellatus]|uniref:Vacuolar protein sorting-associated protein 11 homolog n=1 Tax=Aphanomyces stellatus TaxID=120398 RepID=A0A485L1L1_9STRA|nr:hypothetical protein As57867_013880 [Aphanomyces stellatus]VFT90761.1 Aste57867_13931 [Aphanomyces stellatus]